jgi:hypothetical protein
MNVFVVYCVVTADEKEKQSYILSLDKEKIIFPIYKLESPRYILNEIRYNVKSIFDSKVIKFIEQVIVSGLDIKNELLIDYIKEIDTHQIYDLDHDLFLLCGIVIQKLDIVDPNFNWLKFKYSIQDKVSQPVYGIIDSILQNSL